MPNFEPPKTPATPPAMAFQDVQGVGDQDRPDRRAADDEQLRGLQEHSQVAVLHEVAANDCGDHQYNSNDYEHSVSTFGCFRAFTQTQDQAVSALFDAFAQAVLGAQQH